MANQTNSYIGNVMAWYATPAGVAPTVNSAVGADPNAVSASVGAIQMAGGMWEMLGKELPNMQILGKKIPIAGLGLAGLGLGNDVGNISKSYADNNGRVRSGDLYSALGNLSSAVAAIALAGATVGSAPVLVGVAVTATVVGAGLAIFSSSADTQIDVAGFMAEVKAALQPLVDTFGEAYQSAVSELSNLFTTVDNAFDSFVDGIHTVQSNLTDFFEEMGGISGVLDSAYDFWFGSRSWIQRRDPLTLDLDGDGLETVGIDTGRLVYFDHNGDGVKTATGWVGSDDGFLVLDRNGNGSIDSGAELFGDSTALADGSTATDGFAALAEQDTNGDGVVNQNDSGWGDLRIWRDLNQNGISEAGELQSLDDIGIASLDVGAQSHSQVLADGNRLADLGRFTWATGEVGEIESTTGQSGDIDLAENSFYRQFTDPVPLTAEAQALPEMHGSGALRDMREAASLSPVLLPKRHITYGMTIDDPRDEFPIRSTVPTCRQIDVISGNSHTAKRNHPVFPGGWKRAAELGMQGSMTLPH